MSEASARGAEGDRRTRGSPSSLGRRLSDHRLLVAAVLFAIALVPRVWVALSVAHEPVWDGQYYHAGAQRLAAGLGYGDASGPWTHYPVGYSAFLAVFYWVFGPNPVVASVVGALVGAATAIAVTVLARHAVSELRAVAAGVVVALHPGLVLQAGLVMSEPLSALGLVLAPLVLLHARGRWVVGAVAAGAVLGLTVLVRPQSLLALPALGLVALDASVDRVVGRAGRIRRAAAVVVVALGAAALVVAPWTARNCSALETCAVVSTNGGWNAAIGASPHATGRFDELVASDGCGEARSPADVDACWSRTARTWVRADPLRWARLAPVKLGYTFDRQTFAVAYLAQTDVARWAGGRARAAMIGVSLAQIGVLALAAITAAEAWRRARARWVARALVGALGVAGLVTGVAWPLALVVACAGTAALARSGERALGWAGWVVATIVLTHAVFFGEDRYQVVAVPLMCLLASACFRGGEGDAALVASAA